MKKPLYTLCKNTVQLPRRCHGQDYKTYYPGVSLEAQENCYPEELRRSEKLENLKELLNSNECRPYIENVGNGVTVYAEYYIEEATYEREDEDEDWEFLNGSMYYFRDKNNEPAADKVGDINPIKAARVIAGYTQQQLSDLLDIPLITLSQWETGKRNPPAYVKKMLFTMLKHPEILKSMK